MSVPSFAPKSLGQGLEILPIRKKDDEALAAHFWANQAHLGPWLPWVSKYGTSEEAQKFIFDAEKGAEEGRFFAFGIWVNGKLAGVVNAHWIRMDNRCGQIGYWIGKEYEGKGIATRSILGILEFCFEGLGLNRVEARISPGNHRSRALVERLGFVKEGQLREAERLGEQYADHVVYGMLAREWRGQMPQK